jgi:hypothetical protein
VFLPVVAALESSISTIDLAYQLRLGNLMLDSHQLVRADSFTFTAFGRPWVDQQWGAQVLLALVGRAGGWAGLALLRAGLVGLIFLFVYLACRAAGAWVKRAAWLTIASFGVSVGGLSLRPQLIAMVLFPLTVWLVLDRERHPRRLWAIPVITVLWANTHGTFFLAPLVLGLAWLEDRRRGSGVATTTVWVGLASVAAATVNPFGVKIWSYALAISSNSVITRLIVEWQPPSVRDIAGAAFFLSGVGVVAVLSRRERPTPWPALLTLGVFFAIGLFAVRGIFWWAFIGPPVLAMILADDPARVRKPEKGSMLNVAFAAGLIALAIAFLPWWRPTTGVKGALLDEAPPGITAAVRANLAPGDRIFNAQVWGSWFELAVPENPVFVDARIELFPRAVWGEYAEVSNGREGWQSVLDRWNVRAVAADRDQLKGLLPRIRRDPGWRMAYQGRDGFLFVRRPAPA